MDKIGIKSGRPKFFIIPIPKILSPIPKTSSRSRSPTRKKSGGPIGIRAARPECRPLGLTWEEFLQLTAIITNLDYSIYYLSQNQGIEIKEKNLRVATAAKEYQEFFSDFKYMKFIEEVRKSFKNLISILK